MHDLICDAVNLLYAASFDVGKISVGLYDKVVRYLTPRTRRKYVNQRNCCTNFH